MITARAQALAGEAAETGSALVSAEKLLERAENRTGDDPAWIDFLSVGRLAADAVEIHRDLNQPKAAHQWAKRVAMPTDRYTRSYGIRLAVLTSTHLQQQNLDTAVSHAAASIEVLERVASVRAHDYLRRLAGEFKPWSEEPQVQKLLTSLPEPQG